MSEPKKPAKPADVDERNLVEVGPEFAEATAEDKIFLWWIDNKGKVIGGEVDENEKKTETGSLVDKLANWIRGRRS